jgi:hypothetical protein
MKTEEVELNVDFICVQTPFNRKEEKADGGYNKTRSIKT